MLTQREFGERLKATRKKLKLTQKTISEKINVGQGTLSSWEDGAKVPNILSIINLCEAFDLSLDDLLDLHRNRRTRTGVNQIAHFPRTHHQTDPDD